MKPINNHRKGNKQTVIDIQSQLIVLWQKFCQTEIFQYHTIVNNNENKVNPFKVLFYKEADRTGFFGVFPPKMFFNQDETLQFPVQSENLH